VFFSLLNGFTSSDKTPLTSARWITLYALPLVTSPFLASRLALSQSNVARLLLDLQQLGIVAEMTRQRRHRVFLF
jgi:ribosomal protein S25